MVDSFKYSLESGHLSITQSQGIISLIPKKDKKNLHLAKWRPISVLNHDYKLLAKCIANRIKCVLDLLVHPDQTRFRSGRFIGENILNVEAISAHLSKQGIAGKALMLDFEKAFDSLEWHTVNAALNMVLGQQ